jgi:acyl-CoA reductase-like NAD-dependent aldehyde dehydrogenase
MNAGAKSSEPAEGATPQLLDLLLAQQKAFQGAPFPQANERIRNLDKLLDALLARKEEFVKALDADFCGRSRHESMITDIFMVVSAIKHAKKELKTWMKVQRRDVPIVLGTGKAWVMPQPLGVIGIVGPWNFPLNLTLCPLAAALAAGNRSMIKPSEHTPATSELLKKMIAETFLPDHVVVVTGDASVGKDFVSLPFDHLLFTGSTEVGKAVMKAAAENLTPVTLELGGKSPAIVAPDADLNEAAIDIAFGKVLNAGQICISPDYALVQQEKVTPFLNALQGAVNKYYPDGAKATTDYTSVVNERHYQRLSGYLEEARTRGVQIIALSSAGIQGKNDGRKMAPVAIVDPPEDMKVMHDEIFGPILLIKPYDRLEDAIKYVNDRPRPLALYLFTKSKRVINKVLTGTISGGVTINDTIMHNAIDDLPFGGVGPSGFGHYHGREGFNTFSKLKPVFERSGPRTDRFLRPPFKQIHDFLLTVLLKN